MTCRLTDDNVRSLFYPNCALSITAGRSRKRHRAKAEDHKEEWENPQ